MGVKIANCGSDENGRISGGAAGDQSGKEWYIRDWYSGDGKVCAFRHPDESVRSMISSMAIAAANNDNIGYDQNQRLTFWTQLCNAKYYPENITTKCESDCSASTAAIVRGAGYRLGVEKLKSVSVSMTTYNEKSVLSNAGFTILNGQQPSSNLLAGDILLSSGHTNIVVDSDNVTDTTSGDSVSLNISYDRTTDPLLLEFGYAKQVSDSSDANMGSYLKAQSSSGTYPVSAINMADTLLDIFDIWGFTTSSSGSGTQVAGQVTTKSGKKLTSGTKIEIPSSIKQTGLVSYYTVYPNINWSRNTTQRTIFEAWKEHGSKSSYNIATLDGYYLLAMTTYVGGSVGTLVEVHTTDGTMFQGIMADAKSSGDSNYSNYGHTYGSSGLDVVEWEIMNVSHSTINSSLKEWGVYGKDVDYVVRYDTWLQ